MLFARYLEKIKWVGVPPKTAVRLLNAEETSLNKVRKSLRKLLRHPTASYTSQKHFSEKFQGHCYTNEYKGRLNLVMLSNPLAVAVDVAHFAPYS